MTSYKAGNVSDSIYVEQVVSLYHTLIPTSIMSAGYLAAASTMALETGDRVLAALAIIGCFSSAGRIAVLLEGSRDAHDTHLTFDRAKHLERNFAIAYYQFALVLGVTAAYVFLQDIPRHHMLMMCLLVGYGAGAAVGVGLRPWIAIPSMLTAIVPAIVVMPLRFDSVYWIAALMTSTFLAGGCFSLMVRYRFASAGMTQRLTFQNLARSDALTELPNRLALREWFDANASVGAAEEMIAVHCLDLDDFKPVNDTHGHAAGDELLKAIGVRLKQALRAGDIAARLGGDEFAVIQRNVKDPDEATALARRLRRTISDPFSIDGHTIRVSTCIGFAVCRWKSGDLEQLLALADEALYRAKKGSGIEPDVALMDAVAGKAAA